MMNPHTNNTQHGIMSGSVGGAIGIYSYNGGNVLGEGELGGDIGFRQTVSFHGY